MGDFSIGHFERWSFSLSSEKKSFLENAWSGLANITVVSDKRIVRSHNKRFLV